MTARYFAEADVRAMLVRAAIDGGCWLKPDGRARAEAFADHILSTATPVAAPDLSRLAEAVRDREVVALARIEACTSCEETFTTAEQAAFDPNDNDHCPECGERGTLTTYYGDPQWRIREGDLGIHTRAEDGRFVAEFLDLAPIIAASGTGQGPWRSEVEAYADGVQAGRATMARDAAEAAAGEAERIRRTGRNHAARLACLRAADAIRALVAPLPKPQEPPR